FLEALESNDFKHLPGGVLSKGFVRAYARHIGVDEERMVDAYLLEMKEQEDAKPEWAKPAAPRPHSRAPHRHTAAPVVAIALGLLLAGVLLAVTWSRRRARAAAHDTAPSVSAPGPVA